ncbi:MAG: bifunctional folylpolyglutamate synthase/dihydrofolate synthase [Limnochordia bacterium]|nr:bifunctional folylpolyglutamate synthase/dihydrofolate synthase [Limnochordia bacterium]
MTTMGQRERFGSHLGLERIRLVCEALGNPHKDLPCIHIAGTSGKGSVSALLTGVLMRSGLKVGTFTSPHLVRYNERFRINGEPIDDQRLEQVVARAEAACKEVESMYPQFGAATEFELATAAVFLYFQQEQVELAVIETGLGGRLDSTNVVNPVLTVITTIGFDHQDRLGSTLAEIATEKGGIIKEDVPIISGVQSAVAEITLKRIAAARRAPWRSTNDIPWLAHGWNLSGGSLTFPGIGLIHTGLLGPHQLHNAATALLALTELRTLGYTIPSEAISQGLQEVVWPGRLEVVSRDPFILLDGAHNEEGITVLAESIVQLQKELGEQFTFLFGMLHTKNLELLDPLLPLAKRFVFAAADSGRLAAMQPRIMVDYVKSHGGVASGYENLSEALADATTTTPLCVCGSLYLIGSVKRIFHPHL